MKDGRYRRLTIKINRPERKARIPARLLRSSRLSSHANKDERERQLQEQLASDLPATDVEVYLRHITSATMTGRHRPAFTCPYL